MNFITDLQCIADMKKECDANGLEYELLMQESAKERFLRDVKGNSADFSKHLVILKQKRQSQNSTGSDPVVGAAAPSEPEGPIVGNPKDESAGPDVGAPLISPLHFGLSSLTTPKLLVLLRERFQHARANSRAAVTWPTTTRTTTTTRWSLPTLPTLAPAVRPSLPSLPSFGPVVQPSWLHH